MKRTKIMNMQTFLSKYEPYWEHLDFALHNLFPEKFHNHHLFSLNDYKQMISQSNIPLNYIDKDGNSFIHFLLQKNNPSLSHRVSISKDPNDIFRFIPWHFSYHDYNNSRKSIFIDDIIFKDIEKQPFNILNNDYESIYSLAFSCYIAHSTQCVVDDEIIESLYRKYFQDLFDKNKYKDAKLSNNEIKKLLSPFCHLFNFLTYTSNLPHKIDCLQYLSSYQPLYDFPLLYYKINAQDSSILEKILYSMASTGEFSGRTKERHPKLIILNNLLNNLDFSKNIFQHPNSYLFAQSEHKSYISKAFLDFYENIKINNQNKDDIQRLDNNIQHFIETAGFNDTITKEAFSNVILKRCLENITLNKGQKKKI